MKNASGIALLYGALHAAIDAATVTAAYWSTWVGDATPASAFALVLAYDVVAFGFQVPLGWVVDRWASPKAAMLAGVAMVAACYGALGVHPVAAVALAGAGNALFHLGAGAGVLRLGLDRAFPAGLFVAPGALGLGFGMILGGEPGPGASGPIAVGIAVVAGVVLLRPVPPLPPAAPGLPEGPGRALPPSSLLVAIPAIFLLLASISVRSLVGLSAARGFPRDAWLVLGIPIAACLGKGAGGFLADRLGWVETSVVALLLSAPCIALPHGSAPLLLLGLLLFQMTMPVTLVSTARLMPARLATAFGWTCLALIAGALPTFFFPWNVYFCERSTLAAWILLAALAVFYGLRLAGVPFRFPGGKRACALKGSNLRPAD